VERDQVEMSCINRDALVRIPVCVAASVGREAETLLRLRTSKITLFLT
jgi:hypothetical protein